MNNKILITTFAIVFFVVAGMYLLKSTSAGQTPSSGSSYSNDSLATFATCIADSGAKFYGASWCSHCHNQKLAFKDAASLLPYVECSSSDGKSQTEVCKEEGITSYPTWVFANGESLSGELSYEVLAENTGCTALTL